MTPPRRTPEGTSPQDATAASSPSMPRKAPGGRNTGFYLYDERKPEFLWLPLRLFYSRTLRAGSEED